MRRLVDKDGDRLNWEHSIVRANTMQRSAEVKEK